LNNSPTAELDKLKESVPRPSDLPDLEAVRDRILSGLPIDKQSPEYKRTKAAIAPGHHAVTSGKIGA